jgi:hypothetical protein
MGPYNRFDAGSSVYLTPSGLVPDGDADAHVLKLKIIDGGEGPDLVLPFSFEVLCVNLKDYVVTFVFFGILYVSCKPTAED